MMNVMNNQHNLIAQWLGTGSINLFGRPFAGKDTQGRILADLFSGELIAGGDILRGFHDQQKVQEVMAAGGLIPSDFYFDIVLPFLSRPIIKHKPLFLSSVGRLQGEEGTIMKATADSGHPIKAVILLHLSEEEVWRRFDAAAAEQDRGTRADDSRGVLQNRLQNFQQNTVPVIDFYRNNGLLIEIDGTLSREDVTREILDVLAARALAAN